MLDVTAVVPTIPPRQHLLERALDSVWNQTRVPASVVVVRDDDHTGAWATRNRGVASVTTGWIAFLDDDDEWLPDHVSSLVAHADATGADYVFSWYTTTYIPGGADPLGHYGRVFDPRHPHHTGSATGLLVRPSPARAVPFTAPADDATVGGEDWRFTLDCVARGARVVHLPERTYHWHWDRPRSTHGLPFTWA